MKQVNENFKLRHFLNHVLIAGIVLTVALVSSPILADNSPSSVYDGVSQSASVASLSSLPCTGGEPILLIQDNVPWFAPSDQDPLGANVTELKAQNKNFCIINSGDIGTTNLDQFSEVILSAAQAQSYYDNLFPGGNVHSDLVAYVDNGGILSANLTDNASGPGFGGNWDGRTFIAGLTHVNDLSENDNDIASSSHSVIRGQFGGVNGGQIVDTANLQDLDGWNSSSHGFFTNLPPNTTTILADSLNRPVMIEYSFGEGRVIASQVSNEWRYGGALGTRPQNKKLLANEIGYQSSLIGPEQMARPTEEGELIRGFKPQSSPNHLGIDVDRDINLQPVRATADGVVFHVATDDDDCGDWVWIFHDNTDISKRDGTLVSDISTTYLHITNISVNDGDRVVRGQQIGKADTTGIVTGTHLHFGVRQGSKPPVVACKGSERLGDPTVALNPLEFVDYDVSPRASFWDVNSPVDMILTDPDGLVISKQENEISEGEYVEANYLSRADDSEPSLEEGASEFETIKIDPTKDGDYLLEVEPELDSLQGDTYTIFVTHREDTITLVENVKISDVPSQPYIVRVLSEEIEKIVPAQVKIAPQTLNLGQKGLFTATIEIEKGFGASVADIDTGSIAIEGVSADRVIVAKDKFAITLFKTQDLGNVDTGRDIELKLTGKLQDGTKFEGRDSIRTIGQGKFSAFSSSFPGLASALASLQSLFGQLFGLLGI